MSGLERIKDFLRWLGEVEEGLSAPKPPSSAIGLIGDAPFALTYSGRRYVESGAITPGEKAPLYISSDSILSSSIHVKPEAAIYGASAARIDASRACPFPVESGASSLTPTPQPWRADGAEWRLVAAPKERVDDMRAKLIAAGAKTGAAFTMVDGAPVFFSGSRRPRALIAAAAIAFVTAALAAASITYSATRIETAAQDRLSAARSALTEAETRAVAALAAREAAAGPLRQAQIVGAALSRAPSVADRLSALANATPDDAYLKRLMISPNLATGDFIAPDAAALATALGAAPGFKAARLKGPARAVAAAQQRATLDLTPEAAR